MADRFFGILLPLNAGAGYKPAPTAMPVKSKPLEHIYLTSGQNRDYLGG